MTNHVVNDHTIFVCALQRSGHHAVIQWILLNAGGNPAFLNQCAPGLNPYTSATRTCRRVSGGVDVAPVEPFSGKSLLVCNYEDHQLEHTFPSGFALAMEGWIGPSGRCTHMLVLRDPFNMIASKYRWAAFGTRARPSMESLRRLPQLWKCYAREFLLQTSVMPSPRLCVSYNRWFEDKAYRAALAKGLGISTDDAGRDTIARWGPNCWGDSFDNLTFDGRATEMKTFERWHHFASDPVFLSLVRDPELHELSARIFGRLPNTDQLA